MPSVLSIGGFGDLGENLNSIPNPVSKPNPWTFRHLSKFLTLCGGISHRTGNGVQTLRTQDTSDLGHFGTILMGLDSLVVTA